MPDIKSRPLVLSTNIPGLPKTRGKVREVYDLGDSLLMVATDSISAFDVVLPTGIPDKGRILTQMSIFWLNYLSGIISNHLITGDIDEIINRLIIAKVENPDQYREVLDGRSMLVHKAKPLSIEAIVRGYITGSMWKEYRALRDVSPGFQTILLHGLRLPNNLVNSQQLEEVVFTPSTKANLGQHDENISFEKAKEIVGEKVADQVKNASIALYKRAANYAATQGIIICDTKFELGLYGEALMLIDEVLTPDSSRFWNADTYEPGKEQTSMDKQLVRNYLETLDWDKTEPGPELPIEIVEKTTAIYHLAHRRLTGKDLAA